jgi:hypothetical protein
MTGLRVLGLLGVEDVAATAPFTILLPPGRRIRGSPFTTSRDHRPDRHGARIGPVPATTPSRAVLEVAAGHTDDVELLNLLDRARWRRVLTIERVVATAAELPGHRGAHRTGSLLASGLAEQESPGERAFAAAMEGCVPPLERQVYIAPDLRVDALWRDAALVIEYQGGDTHHHPRDRAADAARTRTPDAATVAAPRPPRTRRPATANRGRRSVRHPSRSCRARAGAGRFSPRGGSRRRSTRRRGG